MSKVIVTNHAYDRMKERVGIGKKAADRLCKKAYSDGIGRDNAKGRLYRYITSEMRNCHEKSINIRIYGEMVYCFLEDPDSVVLVTVFWLPAKLKKQALGVQRKKAV